MVVERVKNARKAVWQSQRVMTQPHRGDSIGPFVIEKELSSGGMAFVYRARLSTPQSGFPPHVAIKIAKLGYDDFLRDEEDHLRHIHHPHIIRPIPIAPGHDEHQQKHYIRCTTKSEPPLWYLALEHLEGDSLAELLQFTRKLTPSTAIQITEQIAMALEYLHRVRGVAHLDVRPDNILFRQDPLKYNWKPIAVLCDFGIAWHNKQIPLNSYGDLPYVAPERRQGAPVTFACDVYSLGIILYEMLTGVRPYLSDEDKAIATHAETETRDPVPPSELCHGTPQLDKVVLRAISRNPEERYPAISSFLEDLTLAGTEVQSQYGPQEPDSPQTLKRIIGSLLICLIAVISFAAGVRSWNVFPPLPTVSAQITTTAPIPTASAAATQTSFLLTSTPVPVGPSLSPSPPTDTPTSIATSTLIPTPGTAGADRVMAYNPGPGVQPQFADPEALLGDPDLLESPCCKGMVQLGQGGSVLLAFVDNSIVDALGADFRVYGESAKDDYLLIEVSADGLDWRSYPKVSESPGDLDLSTIGLEQVVFVRLTDLQPGTVTGAEVDAVVALHNGPRHEDDLPTLSDAVTRSDIVLRDGPNKRMKVVGEVPAGELLTIRGRSKTTDWAKVESDRGISGWCPVLDLGLNVNLNNYTVAYAPPTPKPTATPVPASAILYAENFEDQTANNWTTWGGTWSIETDSDSGGNYFWRGRGPKDYPSARLGIDASQWTRYAFQSRVRFVRGTLFICANNDKGFYTAYIDSNSDWVSFAEWDGKEFTSFSGSEQSIQTGIWYTIRFEIDDRTLRLYIDDRLVITAKRAFRAQRGVGYYMGGGEEIHIDDIRVWTLVP